MKKNLLVVLPIIVASLFLASQSLGRAHASPGTGLVCITTSTTATNCPPTPPTIGPLTIGSTFTVGVFVQGSDAMGGFDIYVSLNPAYVSATSASLGGLIASPTLTSICVNGLSTIGTCTGNAANGPGVVEVTTAESSGGNECGGISPCSGMAFTINYTVVGATTNTPVLFPTSIGCAISSVSSPPDVCVLVADNTGTAISQTIQGATVTENAHVTSTTVSCPSPTVVGSTDLCMATVNDTAVSSPTNPSGTVTFSFNAGGIFSSSFCMLSSSGADTARCSVSYTPTMVLIGPQTQIIATYAGDNTHENSTAAPFTLVVVRTSGTIVSVLNPAIITPGESTTDIATLIGTYHSTGTITYTAFNDSACTSLVFTSADVQIGAPSKPFSPTALGRYYFEASYTGDINNNAQTTGCGDPGEILTVIAKVTPTITSRVSPSSIPFRSSATDLANVTGFNPSGWMGYRAYSDAACTNLVFVSSTVPLGAPSDRFTPSLPGTYYFVAGYSGDANNYPVTTTCGDSGETLTVTLPPLNGLVCMTASAAATSCPMGPPTVGTGTVGATFTIGVFIQNSQAMAGFKIYVAANPTYLNPISVTLGNLIANPGFVTICINDVIIIGDCAAGVANGLGAVEVSAIDTLGLNECSNISPCSGIVFTITYEVVGSVATTPITYPSSPSCSDSSSILGTAECVQVIDNTGLILPETIQGATVAQTDFTLAASASSLTIPAGSTVSDTLTATGLGIFTGPIALTNSSVPFGVIVMFVPNPVTIINPGGAAKSTIQISVVPGVGSPTFTLIVTGTSGVLSHQVSINITIAGSLMPRLTRLTWNHSLSLQNNGTVGAESWKAFVTNPMKSSVIVVIRIVGVSTTNPSTTFDIVCGTSCVVTVGGSVNKTPGLTPVTARPGLTAKFRFEYVLSKIFQGQTVKFTATLYWTTSLSMNYIPSNSITGTFFLP